jgi:DNA mismatch repair protein MutH
MFLDTQPTSEADLLQRCQRMEGLSVAQLAARLSVTIPADPLQRKGLVGLLIERALGAAAGNQSIPDFTGLGIELKTLPIGAKGKPTESTFITSIPLLTIHHQTWKTSTCYSKLQRVLWIPIEAGSDVPYLHRRVGRAFLWSPTVAEERILEQDWCSLSLMIGTGKLAEVDARMGDYLQVRPKAAHGQSLCDGLDEEGHRIKTLPRGFYLRSLFTAELFNNHKSRSSE